MLRAGGPGEQAACAGRRDSSSAWARRQPRPPARQRGRGARSCRRQRDGWPSPLENLRHRAGVVGNPYGIRAGENADCSAESGRSKGDGKRGDSLAPSIMRGSPIALHHLRLGDIHHLNPMDKRGAAPDGTRHMDGFRHLLQVCALRQRLLSCRRRCSTDTGPCAPPPAQSAPSHALSARRPRRP